MTAPDARERTTGDILLAWDADRPRSQQRELGWSEVGGCRRRAGYRMAGTAPSNSGSSLPAVFGTAIHGVAQQALEASLAPGDLCEQEVRFAGVLGHFDRYEAATGSLLDIKTTSSRNLDRIRRDGPPERTLWQINGYAAGLVSSGRPVHRLVIDYLARDTGEEWRWVGVPDPTQVRAALAWLAEVRAVELEWLPRDFEPDSVWCRGCPYRDICWPEGEPYRDPRQVLFQADPDAVAWAEKLDQARADKADAERREKEAKGALDALRPNDAGTETLDVGYEKHLRWTVSATSRIDNDRVREDYAAAGAEPPLSSSPKVTLTLVRPKKDSAVTT